MFQFTPGQFENLDCATARVVLISPLISVTIGLLLYLALRSLRDAALV